MKLEIDQAVREYHDFLDRTLSPKKASEAKNYDNWFKYYFERASKRTEELRDEYDLGFAITSHGLWLGYLFERAGLPMYIAHVKRKGNGAQVKLDDKLTEKDLEGRRIILLDDAIETGRTLRAVTNQIRGNNPEVIDALVYHSFQEVSPERYGKIQHYGIPEGLRVPHREGMYLLAKDFDIEGINRVLTLG